MLSKISFKFISAVLLALLLLCSCDMNENTETPSVTALSEVSYDPNAPVISFETETVSSDGLPEYYLFDDNPEHLNSKFLADGDVPSSIAHFENLTSGIYTVFSYHHRGYSVDVNADLYYDAVFSTNDSGSFEILNLGLDHDWDWNQAWADYSGVPVVMPEFLRTFNCTCGENCTCADTNGKCVNSDCQAVIKDQRRDPKTDEYNNLNVIKNISSGSPVYLSEFVSHISDEDINHFRYIGWNEPMWMMMKFKVTDGTVNFDTIAYQNIDEAKENFSLWLKGPFDNEPQYKGIAKNAPIVTAEFDYIITDDTASGPVPITVKNMRVPDGYTIPDGTFATNVNTWREPLPIAAESDMMLLEYIDDTKLTLYGKKAEYKDNIWRFDPFHTKTYGGYDVDYSNKLESFGIVTGDKFMPNGSMADIQYPKGTELSSNEFYKYTACNLGNFGVTEKYKIHVSNTGKKTRKFTFDLKSIAGQVYRYKQTDKDGKMTASDGGQYIMKRFDDDPKENPDSTADPKERLDPAEYSDTLKFDIEPGEEYDIEVEVTTLTGCVAPMHNTFGVE